MHANSSDDFEDTASICWKCITDEYLQRLTRARPDKAKCCVSTSTEEPTIRIEDLAAIVEPVMRRHFTWGREVHRFRDDNDDAGWPEQRGCELDEVLERCCLSTRLSTILC